MTPLGMQALSGIGKSRSSTLAEERSTQMTVGIARVHHPAGRQGIKRQTLSRSER